MSMLGHGRQLLDLLISSPLATVDPGLRCLWMMGRSVCADRFGTVTITPSAGVILVSTPTSPAW